MAFKTCCFFIVQGAPVRFQTELLLLRRAFFLTNGVNLGFFLTEILYQWNIAWAYPGAGTAFNTVGDIAGRRFVVLLPFTEPVKLLWQEIGRTGIGACATANAAFSSGVSPISLAEGPEDSWLSSPLGLSSHGGVKTHQRPARNRHLVGGRAETRVVVQMTNRRILNAPDVYPDGI